MSNCARRLLQQLTREGKANKRLTCRRATPCRLWRRIPPRPRRPWWSCASCWRARVRLVPRSSWSGQSKQSFWKGKTVRVNGSRTEDWINWKCFETNNSLGKDSCIRIAKMRLVVAMCKGQVESSRAGWCWDCHTCEVRSALGELVVVQETGRRFSMFTWGPAPMR